MSYHLIFMLYSHLENNILAEKFFLKQTKKSYLQKSRKKKFLIQKRIVYLKFQTL